MAKGRDRRKRVAKMRKKEGLARTVEALPDEPPRTDEPDAFVRSTLKPKPRLGSGAIALPQPEEVEEEGAVGVPSRLR